MGIIKKAWDKISYTGIHRGLETSMKNKIILSNRIAFFACLFAFVVGFTFIKLPFIFSIFVLSFFVYVATFFFNYMHWFELSRFMLVVMPALFNITVGGLITTETNVSNRFTFIVLIICPALLYQLSEKYKMLAGVLWLCMLYLLTDIINSMLPRIEEIRFDSEYDNPALVVYRGLISMLLFLLSFYYLMQLHRKTEIRLAQSLKNTKEKNRLIGQSSEELEKINTALNEQQQEIEMINLALRSQLLKAQLDPHFMYNALNSIQYFIMQHDSSSAIGYLSKFSKLMRQVLENSVNETVSISDEIKALTYYMDLERMRFNNSFSYIVDIDENIDPENTEIPSMLLQPYIENAIIHGMRTIKENGIIKLLVMLQADAVLCIVEDNGKGRKAENEYQVLRNHKSRATEATLNRIALLQSGAGIVTIDLTDANGTPTGTRVEIKIPLSL